MIEIKDTVLLTFPRSGSSALEKYLLQKSGAKIYKTHRITECSDKRIITIIRDPMDSMTSFIAMTLHYFPNIEGTEQWNQIFGNLSWTGIFNEIYGYLINNADLVIHYDDLMKSPEKVMDILNDYLNINFIDKDAVITLGDDNPAGKYLATSTTSPVYNIAKEKAQNLDMSSCYEKYYILKAKKRLV